MAQSPIIEIMPAIYSKSRSVSKLIASIDKAPKQLANSLEGLEGYVPDFTLLDKKKYGHGYGTLRELVENYNAKQFVVHCTDGKVFLKTSGPEFVMTGFSITSKPK